MRNLLGFAIGLGLLSINLQAATVAFTTSTVGVNGTGDTVFRYLYDLTGVSLQQHQEVDIRFDPGVYGILTNGVAPAGFSLALFQPNNPAGAFGDYSVLAVVPNPNVGGIFSVDFTLKPGHSAGPQPFLINQYQNDDNTFIATIASGVTTPAGGNPVPEPSTWMPAVAGLLLFTGIARSARRQRYLG